MRPAMVSADNRNRRQRGVLIARKELRDGETITRRPKPLAAQRW
jgi:hypothetical protein